MSSPIGGSHSSRRVGSFRCANAWFLHMRFIEDRAQSEIAATIGLSQMHVSRILRGAIERLELAAGSELEY
jgi:hypothetical protein